MRAAFWTPAFCSILLATAMATAQPVAPRQADKSPAPLPVTTIHTTSPLVLVDVVVTDKHGQLIHGFTAKDFHVFEGATEQHLSTFEEHRSTAASPAAIIASLDPDTYTNRPVSAQSAPLCVILLDSLNTALSDQSYAHSELLKLAESLPAGSRVAVFRLGAKLTMLQGFTEDSTDLVAMLRSTGKLAPQAGPFFDDTVLTQSLSAPDLTAFMGGIRGGPRAMSSQTANQEILQSQLTVASTLQALRTLGLYLRGLPGRKNLVWLSGSFPIDILPDLDSGSPNAIGTQGHFGGFAGQDTHIYMTAIRDLAHLLQAGNIVVYPIDVRGVSMNALYTGSRQSSGGAANEVQAVTQGLTTFAGSNGQMQAAMEIMADVTGGRAYFNTNDISGSILEALNDGSNYYSLAYVPSDGKWDGKYRKIEVRLDKPDLRLYYRQGYFAEIIEKSKDALPIRDPEMGAAMLRGTPVVAEIGFELHLKPDSAVRIIPAQSPALLTRGGAQRQLTGPAQHYEMDLTIKPSDIQFSEVEGEKYQSNLSISAIAYDAQGKMLNTIGGSFHAPLSSASYTAVIHEALHLFLKPGMDLPVGRIYLRVGVRDLASGKIGAFEIPLDVGVSDKPESALRPATLR